MIRRRIFSAAAGFFVVTATSAAAPAQERENLLETRHQKKESPQNFAVELRLAPYSPNIDSEAGLHGKTPYKDVFGTMKRLEVSAEFDWQVVRVPHFGTVGPGVSAGYTSMGDTAVRLDTGKPSGEQTSLDIFPLYGALVVRLDVLERDAKIPIVPYGKVGAGLAFWHAYNDVGTSLSNGVEGKGHTFGLHGAVGLDLQLNALDPTAARNADINTGINNTYLFGELMFADYTGLGQAKALRVGTNTFVGGLAFEF